jgi:hypothetical protein
MNLHVSPTIVVIIYPSSGVSLAESVPVVVVIIFNGILSGNYSDAYLADANLPHDIAKEFDIKYQ